MHQLIDVLVFFAMIPVYFIESLIHWLIPKSFKAKNVSGEIVLVTGAGNGIGREISLRFAKLGCILILWDINETGNNTTAKLINESGGKAFTYTCDLSNRQEIYKFADLVKKEVGIVTILINNAGVVTGKPLLETPDHLIQRTFDVNTLAHFWTIKAFLPDMIKLSKGHIVNVASVLGMKGSSRLTDYCASKFADVGLTESLHLEFVEQGYDKYIKTSVVCPFYIQTGMFDGLQQTSRILPPLTPEYTGDSVVAGILANDQIIFVPRHMGLVMFSSRNFPWKLTYHLLEVLGDLNTLMKSFKGRIKEN